jgi:hypothetical protein
MKYTLIIFLSFLQVLTSQTQIELNTLVKIKYEKSVQKLNVLNSNILLDCKNKKNRDQVLQEHKKWIEYRDNYMNKKYPFNERKEYGTYFNIRWYIELTRITNERIERIKKR